MNIKCLLGLHQWNHCKCSNCDKTRDEEHQWNGCKCNTCGEVRNTEHHWNGCKCAICGRTRNEEHDWETLYKSCSGCPNEPLSVEDLSGSLCYEANGCTAQRCRICGKQTEWKRPGE